MAILHTYFIKIVKISRLETKDLKYDLQYDLQFASIGNFLTLLYVAKFVSFFRLKKNIHNA